MADTFPRGLYMLSYINLLGLEIIGRYQFETVSFVGIDTAWFQLTDKDRCLFSSFFSFAFYLSVIHNIYIVNIFQNVS